MVDHSRRRFLKQVGMGGAALAAAPGLHGLVAAMAHPFDPLRRAPARPDIAGGYGPLAPAGAELALPEGFQYKVFGREGSPMSDGRPTPRAHDGMDAFARPDGVRLMRNHEESGPPGLMRLIGDPAKAYDPTGGGGVTALDIEIDPSGEPYLVTDHVALGGTIVNCAGGVTPWGSWITCEETTRGVANGFAEPHGYAFDVPADTDDDVMGVALKAMGRFEREAVAVDPATGIVYQTEDYALCGFYRFLPDAAGRLAAGGRLQMLAVVGRPKHNARFGARPGAPMEATWVDIDDPDPADAERYPLAVFAQGYRQGGAAFSRLEGCFWADGAVYFNATDGGDARAGQLWQYRPDAADGGTLTLIFESPDRTVLDGPDNLCVSPRGGLLICEDPYENMAYLRGLTTDGEIYDFARNVLNDREFAGSCFSPDGKVLFVNLQGDTEAGGPGDPSMTLAIWGPWERGSL